jgi:hypothetical protein
VGLRGWRRWCKDERIPDSYRRGFAAELLRAEEYYKAGKLQAVEAVVEGGRVDLLLVTDDIVEVKYWTQSHTVNNIGKLTEQLTRYQATGRPILLELFRTKTDPITEGYIERFAERSTSSGSEDHARADSPRGVALRKGAEDAVCSTSASLLPGSSEPG